MAERIATSADLERAPAGSPFDVVPAETLDFYRTVMRGLLEREIPFLIGGAFALARHAGIERWTRDLDVFARRATLPSIERAVREMGFEAREFSPHWLWKIETEMGYVDLIWASGNGTAPVDEAWFTHSVEGEVFGVPVRLIPAEEMIWSKAYIQERERFDGADIAHILQLRAESLDWERLLARFGPHWRVLLGHLVMFGFIYPGQRHRLPPFVMRELLSRLKDELVPDSAPPLTNVCGGTLLSRSQYLIDVRERGYRDARLPPFGAMSHEQIAAWTRLAEPEASMLTSQSPTTPKRKSRPRRPSSS
jgi:hypothetical protein